MKRIEFEPTMKFRLLSYTALHPLYRRGPPATVALPDERRRPEPYKLRHEARLWTRAIELLLRAVAPAA